MIPGKVKAGAVAVFAAHVLLNAAFPVAGIERPSNDGTRHGPAAATEVHAKDGGAPKASPRPEDYWIPWDNWLKRRGSPIPGRDVWTASQETGIRGEMLICISYAETNLGRVAQRGSTTNIGSVGSYDATDTTHHAGSIVEGLAMIGRTLNNDRLGKKTTVAQLSRKSEPYGPVYAESRSNWERNVLTCLGQITGKTVTNQWEFRTR